MLVSKPTCYRDLDVIGPKTAKFLAEFINHPEPPMPPQGWVEAQIGLLSVKPSRKATVADMKLVLDVYVPILCEYSKVDLGYAIGRIVRENKWFPDISEIVALAEYARARRAAKRNMARMLIMKHEQEWTHPISQEQLVKIEDIQAIKDEVAREFSDKMARQDHHE